MTNPRAPRKDSVDAPDVNTTPRVRLQQTPPPLVFQWIQNSENPFIRRLAPRAARAERATTWVMRLKPYRVIHRYLAMDGNLLAAGISFQAVFAVFAAVYVGFAITGIWLGNNAEVFQALVEIINRAVPGLIGTDGEGIIAEEQLSSASLLGWTGVIAAVGLIWTAIGWLYYTRQAVRSIFALPKVAASFFLLKVVDLVLALAFGVLLLVSATLSVASTQALSWLLALVGLEGTFWVTVGSRVVGLVVAVVVNLVTLGAMYRVLSRIRIPWRNLFGGALLGSLVLSLLSVASSAVIAGASRNPLLATFAVFIGLMLWFNLVSRVILASAAWIAVGLDDQGISVRTTTPEEQAAEELAARRLIAEAELREARESLRHAKGPAVWFARRRVRHAEDAAAELIRQHGEAPESPATEASDPPHRRRPGGRLGQGVVGPRD
ncbi:YihY/virulence factor BrkB family protein [Plantibacter sp. ME-Dv--P-122b]|uniref:YihY/virulence factor BrkB family protein n=1 Tax=Plantibacter sp. ME-Dv--P-122b TaxID=3040300 RepID=UPI00254E7AE9|nr:YihY/virulence factor BrkB family protein [Plantibacter sp. ME-Dv--P-122b]